ncbi:hypothetical protein CIPAW_01G236300 [Carya illinoinensis]|uniref:Uncharacterized protein n=1 Tax=Carya illinoinensis TaxID=32201 RepID=A0A8T1RSX0_CARIL|nr:hypothetical protein CIPAW_01G236300 [Carya illinoinensis]
MVDRHPRSHATYLLNKIKSLELAVASLKSVPLSFLSQGLPLPRRFPQYHSPHEAEELCFQAQKAVQELLAHFQTHRAQPHPTGLQGVQTQVQFHRCVDLFQC